MERRLLIISCSKSKKKEPKYEKIPAIERYTGKIFTLITDLIKDEHFPEDLDIRILTKFEEYPLINLKFGMIWYEIEMDDAIANKLKPLVIKELKTIIENNNYKEVTFNLGPNFTIIVEGIENELDKSIEIIKMYGNYDERIKKLKEWL